MNEPIEKLIEVCTRFAVAKGLCEKSDAYLVRNRLLSTFSLTAPYDGDVNVPDSLVPTLEKMTDYAVEKGMLEMNTPAFRAMFDTKLCACLLMMQSQAEAKFAALYKESPQKATDWFYDLCRDVNYIRTFDVARNIRYDYESSYGPMEITINLTKPEKDPKEIELQKKQPQTNYPKCMLCMENIGYAGRVGYPSHETLRTIPLTLDGDLWHFQYSPYVYYDEHCIVFCDKHTPMTMDRQKFVRLFDFLRQFPHYFIGSNTQLPVVGGSILTHEHFQGGRHTMPMELAKPRFTFDCGNASVSACVVNWPMTCLRFASASIGALIEIGDRVLSVWRDYDDDACRILSHSDNEEHNTITPIVRVNKDGKYELDIVLRNNVTTDELPLGVYHPHPDKHHIKKENIGLIEVMGLFILPGRLKTELEEVASAWVEGNSLPETNIHASWFNSFKDTMSPKNTEEAMSEIRRQVGLVCEAVLQDAGVYKEDENGQKGLRRFLDRCGFEVKA